jgi:hypothetical protein
MPQMPVRRPLLKFNLRHEIRLKPLAVFHLLAGERIHRAPLLRYIADDQRKGLPAV